MYFLLKQNTGKKALPATVNKYQMSLSWQVHTGHYWVLKFGKTRSHSRGGHVTWHKHRKLLSLALFCIKSVLSYKMKCEGLTELEDNETCSSTAETFTHQCWIDPCVTVMLQSWWLVRMPQCFNNNDIHKWASLCLSRTVLAYVWVWKSQKVG